MVIGGGRVWRVVPQCYCRLLTRARVFAPVKHSFLNWITFYESARDSCFPLPVNGAPQILVIRNAGTAEGLSLEMFEIETYTLLVSALYGFTQLLPFNTYGESLILAVQNAVILAMVYSYSRTPVMRRLAVTGAYVALVAGVMAGRWLDLVWVWIWDTRVCADRAV